MVSTNLYLIAKKIHRLLVILITIIGLIMAGTGILLKYENFSERLTFINLESIRELHNNLSPYFTLVFLAMMVTGLVLYLYPTLRNKENLIK